MKSKPTANSATISSYTPTFTETQAQVVSQAMLAVSKPRMDCMAWPKCACILRGNYKRDCAANK